MNAKVFVDSNIFVYIQSTSDAEKQSIARQVLRILNCSVSTQVLSEVSNVLSKKAGFSYKQIGEIVDGIIQICDISIIENNTIRSAHRIAEKYKFGYYDSLIIASAIESGCKYLLSEDFSDGQIIDKKVTVINIFKHPEFLNQ